MAVPNAFVQSNNLQKWNATIFCFQLPLLYKGVSEVMHDLLVCLFENYY